MISNISQIAFIGSYRVKPLMTIKDFYNNIKWSPTQRLDGIICQHKLFYVQRNAPFYREPYSGCLRYIDTNIKKIFDKITNTSPKINKSKFNFKELTNLYEDSLYGGLKVKDWLK